MLLRIQQIKGEVLSMKGHVNSYKGSFIASTENQNRE